MAISTNSVIHYTERFDYLKGIITSGGFRIKYCLENIGIKTGNLDCAFPMVSFCDIPLSEVKNHIDTYGNYGIGLSKTWAKKCGLNPVLYIEKNSLYAALIPNQASKIQELKKDGLDNSSLQHGFISLLAYCKNYEGPLVKGKINSESYRFYDEREWRYIATDIDLGEAMPYVPEEAYSKDKAKYNSKLDHCYLRFDHNDISYLIVDNEDEIPDLLKILSDTYDSIATAKELKVLSTRIITKNQIWNDF